MINKRVSLINIFIIIVVFIGILPLLVNVFSIRWSIIDDPSSFQAYSNIDRSIKNVNIEESWYFIKEGSGSRFRPAYTTFNYLTFLFLGKNIFIQHFSRLLIYGILTFFFLKYLFRFSNNIFLSLFFGYLFIVSPFVIENIVRLGTPEFISLILFIPLVGFYTKFIDRGLNTKELILVWLILLLLIFTKEIFLVLTVPIFLAIYSYYFLHNINSKIKYTKKNYIRTLLYFFVLVVFYSILHLINKDTLSDWSSGTEISNYKLSLKMVIDNYRGIVSMMWNYSKMELIILCISSVIFLAEIFNKKLRDIFVKDRNVLFIIPSFLIFLFLFLAQIPWLYVMERYFIFIQFFLILSSFLCLVHLSHLIKICVKPYLSKILNIIIYAAVIYFAIPQIYTSNIYAYNYSTWYAGFTQFEQEYISSVQSAYLNYHSKVVYNYKDNISNVEVFKSTNQYINLIGGADIGALKYLETLCNSRSDKFTKDKYLVIDTIGDPYANLSKFKPIDSGQKRIPQIKKEIIVYNWKIYHLRRDEICN